MNPFLLVHLICVGIWLGCILTEALFERALLGQGRQQEKILVGLHQRVDLFVEIPAFVLVLVTGALMLSDTATSKLLDIKVGLGLLAILANLYCRLGVSPNQGGSHGPLVGVSAAGSSPAQVGRGGAAGIAGGAGFGCLHLCSALNPPFKNQRHSSYQKGLEV